MSFEEDIIAHMFGQKFSDPESPQAIRFATLVREFEDSLDGKGLSASGASAIRQAVQGLVTQACEIGASETTKKVDSTLGQVTEEMHAEANKPGVVVKGGGIPLSALKESLGMNTDR